VKRTDRGERKLGAGKEVKLGGKNIHILQDKGSVGVNGLGGNSRAPGVGKRLGHYCRREKKKKVGGRGGGKKRSCFVWKESAPPSRRMRV